MDNCSSTSFVRQISRPTARPLVGSSTICLVLLIRNFTHRSRARFA